MRLCPSEACTSGCICSLIAQQLVDDQAVLSGRPFAVEDSIWRYGRGELTLNRGKNPRKIDHGMMYGRENAVPHTPPFADM